MSEKHSVFGKESEISKIQLYHWTVRDSPGEFQWISKDDLNIDPAYQRTDNISNDRVLKIAQSWSWVSCAVLTVSMRPDGSLWVIDGQHRLLAARKRSDVNQLPCMVFEGAGVRDEAGGFVDINTVRGPVKAFHKWKALLVKGDETAQGIQRIAQESGYSISCVAGDNKVCAVHTMMTAYEADRNFGTNILKRVFPLIARIANGKQIVDRLIAGVCYLERYLGKNSYGTLLSQDNSVPLIRCGQDEILRKIATVVALTGKSGERVYAQGILNIINHKRRTRRIPDIFGPSAEAIG